MRQRRPEFILRPAPAPWLSRRDGFGMESEKVLIVEDEEHERTGLAELVAAWGYGTETASNGIEALEKILS